MRKNVRLLTVSTGMAALAVIVALVLALGARGGSDTAEAGLPPPTKTFAEMSVTIDGIADKICEGVKGVKPVIEDAAGTRIDVCVEINAVSPGGYSGWDIVLDYDDQSWRLDQFQGPEIFGTCILSGGIKKELQGDGLRGHVAFGCQNPAIAPPKTTLGPIAVVTFISKKKGNTAPDWQEFRLLPKGSVSQAITGSSVHCEDPVRPKHQCDNMTLVDGGVTVNPQVPTPTPTPFKTGPATVTLTDAPQWWEVTPKDPGFGFLRVVVEIGKADQLFKLASVEFRCGATGVPVLGVFKDHLKDVNPPTDPLPHHEVWSGTFPTKCNSPVVVNLSPVDPQNKPLIKVAHVENGSLESPANVEFQGHGIFEFKVTSQATFFADRVEIDVGTDSQAQKVTDAAFFCQSTSEWVNVFAPKRLDKNVNPAPDPLPHHEVWGATFSTKCIAPGGGVTAQVFPADRFNQIVVKSARVQNSTLPPNTPTPTPINTPEVPKTLEAGCVLSKTDWTAVECKFPVGDPVHIGGTVDFGQDLEPKKDGIAGWHEISVNVMWPPGLGEMKNSEILCPPGSTAFGKDPFAPPGTWDDRCEDDQPFAEAAGPVPFVVTLNCTEVGAHLVNVTTYITREDDAALPPNNVQVPVECNPPKTSAEMSVTIDGIADKICEGVKGVKPVIEDAAGTRIDVCVEINAVSPGGYSGWDIVLDYDDDSWAVDQLQDPVFFDCAPLVGVKKELQGDGIRGHVGFGCQNLSGVPKTRLGPITVLTFISKKKGNLTPEQQEFRLLPKGSVAQTITGSSVHCEDPVRGKHQCDNMTLVNGGVRVNPQAQPTPTQTPNPEFGQEIVVNLTMIRVGNDPLIREDPWTWENVKAQFTHASQIWRKANISLHWASQPDFNDIDDPLKPPVGPGGDGDIIDPKLWMPPDPDEMGPLCMNAREVAKGKSYPVTFIQHFVDAAGDKSVIDLAQTLRAKGKTAICSAISVQAHEAEIAVPKKGEKLAHELGHAFCLQDEADPNNLMHGSIPSGQKLTKDQMRTARDCASRLMLPWDIDGNKAVTVADIFDVASHFGDSIANLPVWTADEDYRRDMDWNGAITVADIFAVASHFGQTAKVNLPTAAAIQAHAAKFGVAEANIVVNAKDPKDWPDSCLGLGVPPEICFFVITPGYRIVLKDGTNTAAWRTDLDGTEVRQE